MLHYTITFKKVLKRYKRYESIHEQSNNDYFLHKYFWNFWPLYKNLPNGKFFR